MSTLHRQLVLSAALAAGATPATARPAAAPDAHREAMRVRYRTTVVDGLRLFHREAGRPEAPAIVLLHGAWSSSHMFRDLIPLLAPHFRVIAPDLPGFGHSEVPARERFAYTFESLARVTDAHLRALGVSRHVLYVQDYGGPVGFRLASAHPERVAGLVIQNANAYLEGLGAEVLPTLGPLWRARTPESEARARAIFSPEGVRFRCLSGARTPEALSPDAWTHDIALLARPGQDAIQLDLLEDYRTNVDAYPSWQAYFRRHRPPTLIAWGRNDPVFVADGARAYLRDLPGARLVWLDGGHFALEEYAPEVADAIVDLFAPPSRP